MSLVTRAYHHYPEVDLVVVFFEQCRLFYEQFGFFEERYLLFSILTGNFREIFVKPMQLTEFFARFVLMFLLEGADLQSFEDRYLLFGILTRNFREVFVDDRQLKEFFACFILFDDLQLFLLELADFLSFALLAVVLTLPSLAFLLIKVLRQVHHRFRVDHHAYGQKGREQFPHKFRVLSQAALKEVHLV